MGTMLQKTGLAVGERPELLCLTAPEQITTIHRAYIQAGADLIYANTFGANELKLADTGHTVEEVVDAAIRAARRAAQGTHTAVALDMGPLGELLEPAGLLPFEKAYACYARMARQGQASGADVAVLETMTDLYEVKAAILAVQENSDLPIMVSMTFEENGRTFTGCSVEALGLLAQGLGVDAVGINCSLGPDEILPLARRLCACTDLPVFIKPNAGLPDPATGAYTITPQAFAQSMAHYQELGICMVGGCCGTSPQFIQALHSAFAGKVPAKRTRQPRSAVCTATRVVQIQDVTVIGERINPTGKKLMRQALLDGDMGHILRQAVSQADAGAQILDVNVGAPGVHEAEVLPQVVRQIQAVTDLPLQLDSTDPAALEAALRIYNGKAIVNSVNGKQEVLDAILPLVKRYGAAVVGLTLDERGIPTTAEDRVQIARHILHEAERRGIPREDVFIDCLTLTASAQQEAVPETLEALCRVSRELGLKTVLGVSNISFGLPNRDLLNHSFLLMALQNGLDLPILNPNSASMMDAVRAFRLLTNRDPQAQEFIRAYQDLPAPSPVPAAAVPSAAADSQPPLVDAVRKGLAQEAAALTAQLLEHTDPMEIVNRFLIPALDQVGNSFEAGRLFLPQLLQAANAAQRGFDEVKKALQASGRPEAEKGPIVLATVQGDIHDIGKNIVKVILENYGYRVIDLGRDVPAQAILDAVQETHAPLVGLSALMTTTLNSMEQTIRLLHRQGCRCKIVVGGAVLTPDYALQIGADHYARDAKQAVDLARQIIG